jgi:hypothetical protein
VTPLVGYILIALLFLAYCVYKTKQAGEKLRRDLAEWVMSDDLTLCPGTIKPEPPPRSFPVLVRNYSSSANT